MFDKTLFISEISKIEQHYDGSYIVIKNNTPYHIPDNDEYRQEYNALKEYIQNNNIQVDAYIPKVFKVIDNNSEEYIKRKRDMLLNKADIILMKYEEQVSLNIIQENNEYYNALLQYKQNLRDITKQIDFPENVIWPVLPEYI